MTDITPTKTYQITPAGGSLANHPAAVYLAGLTPLSRRTQRAALNKIAEILTLGAVVDCLAVDWTQIRHQHAAAIRARLAESYAPATANRMLAALRGTLKEAWRLGLLEADDYRRACDIDPVKGETLLAGRGLTPGEIKGLMGSCAADSTPAGVRDAAIIALMYSGGPRRFEVVAFDLADYDPESGRLLIKHGKGNKQRAIFLANGAKDALDDWLLIRGSEPGALFWPITKAGTLTPRHMSDQAIYNLLAKRAKQAGVKAFSPHDLRRSFVSDMLDAGVDIGTVAGMAGHGNITVTSKYDRRGEEAKKTAAGLLHVPYTRRA